ncbi:MAG TPA: signal recognition particle-docking protein FtsY, partial [Thermoanaerobacterales bacterium]|nr:signal recognition particle-docking protein FtsY [Thermoanaerobacterales bacterium]
MGETLFEKLKDGLSKTKKNIISRIENLFHSYGSLNDEFYEELEEILISSDIGVASTYKIIEELKNEVRKSDIQDAKKAFNILKEILISFLQIQNCEIKDEYPLCIIIVGVNGVGKTTTIGKLAYSYKKSGKNVLLAAGDTFRAAAVDQLEIWAQRAGVNLIKQGEGSDPAAVVYDAVHSAKARKCDVLICDTAGRLHSKKNLMEELKKIKNIIIREYPEAAHETILVIDATTGQNALAQAKLFDESI